MPEDLVQELLETGQDLGIGGLQEDQVTQSFPDEGHIKEVPKSFPDQGYIKRVSQIFRDQGQIEEGLVVDLDPIKIEDARIDENTLQNIFGNFQEEYKVKTLETDTQIKLMDGVFNSIDKTAEIKKGTTKNAKNKNKFQSIAQINLKPDGHKTKSMERNKKINPVIIEKKNTESQVLPGTSVFVSKLKTEPNIVLEVAELGHQTYNDEVETASFNNKRETQYNPKVKEDTNNQTNNQTKCPECNKQFVRLSRSETGLVKGTRFTQAEIEDHMKNHGTKKQTSPCDECHLEIETEHLKIHKETAHIKSSELKCNFCARTFSQPTNMNTHMKSMHFEAWAKWKISQMPA